MELGIQALRSLVFGVIGVLDSYECTVHGIGMFRIRLSDQTRINIWHKDLQEENVSLIHSHPWDYTSRIIHGELKEYLYRRGQEGNPYDVYTVQCGDGCGVKHEGKFRYVNFRTTEHGCGYHYTRHANEIHSVDYEPFTLSLMTKHEGGTGHARVLEEVGKPFGDAQQREATRVERIWVKSNVLRLLEDYA